MLTPPSRAREAPSLSFILQYWQHPTLQPTICGRLQHPKLEVLVHADSHTAADAAALSNVTRAYGNVRVVQSANLHEIRGYNKAATHANGWLLAFSQDDRLPPRNTSWVDSVIRMFEQMPPPFALLGLHRGSPRMVDRGAYLGACGDFADDDPMQFNKLRTRDMEVP